MHTSIQIVYLRMYVHAHTTHTYVLHCELHQVANNDVIDTLGYGFKWQ